MATGDFVPNLPIRTLTPLPHGEGNQYQHSNEQYIRYEERIGYHLEDHFVTLSSGWR